MAKLNGSRAGQSQSLVLIPCQVEPGMFREEWLVFVRAIDPADPERGLRVQLLVDRREVTGLRQTPKRNQPADGWLRVALAGKRKGFAHVVLPQPAGSTGEQIIVNEDLVRQETGE